MTELILGMAILVTAILGTNQLQPVEWEAWLTAVVQLSTNNPLLVSVDLIRETRGPGALYRAQE